MKSARDVAVVIPLPNPAASCPFQRGSYLLSCKAHREVYVPNRYELREYCRTERYRICPSYMTAERKIGSRGVLIPPRRVVIE